MDASVGFAAASSVCGQQRQATDGARRLVGDNARIEIVNRRGRVDGAHERSPASVAERGCGAALGAQERRFHRCDRTARRADAPHVSDSSGRIAEAPDASAIRPGGHGVKEEMNQEEAQRAGDVGGFAAARPCPALAPGPACRRRRRFAQCRPVVGRSEGVLRDALDRILDCCDGKGFVGALRQ